jgi:signal transduction histidine kinase
MGGSITIRRAGWPQFLAGLFLTLVILAVVIAVITLRLRNSIQEQILNRDGAILTAVASMLHEDEGDLLSTVLQTSALRGVYGVRLFDQDGFFWSSVPVGLQEIDLPEDELRLLRVDRSIPRYAVSVVLGDELGFLLLHDVPQPVFSVTVPIRGEGALEPDGFAEYIMDGHPIAEEFAALDRQLFAQATIAFAFGGGLIGLISCSAFVWLRRTQEKLVDRTRHLLLANQELLLFAKTSAIGAIAAHLIHGLKNPLAGLNEHLESLAHQGEGEWTEAADAARRMREMIAEVVDILRDGGTDAYELTVPEIGEMLASKVRKLPEGGSRFSFRAGLDVPLPAKQANISYLILLNLVNNALENSRPPQRVDVVASAEAGGVAFDVSDEGPGLPPERVEQLFAPGSSTRLGGTGLGLAISHALAQQIGAAIELVRTGKNGSLFRLRIPLVQRHPATDPASSGRERS